ncbi:MAG TPA: ribonuclease E inhibitor RraB, partial [Steroidobacteraceae bacterium]|nr:ribonuclease E inhibitor RraB [Steroidobacteraceae bacterium]
NEYPVDFFLALPDEAAVQGARVKLEADGFGVDVKPMENDPELHFSLHATKTMRLIVPDMQDIGRRMTALATEYRGRYDGWAA